MQYALLRRKPQQQQFQSQQLSPTGIIDSGESTFSSSPKMCTTNHLQGIFMPPLLHLDDPKECASTSRETVLHEQATKTIQLPVDLSQYQWDGNEEDEDQDIEEWGKLGQTSHDEKLQQPQQPQHVGMKDRTSSSNNEGTDQSTNKDSSVWDSSSSFSTSRRQFVDLQRHVERSQRSAQQQELMNQLQHQAKVISTLEAKLQQQYVESQQHIEDLQDQISIQQHQLVEQRRTIQAKEQEASKVEVELLRYQHLVHALRQEQQQSMTSLSLSSSSSSSLLSSYHHSYHNQPCYWPSSSAQQLRCARCQTKIELDNHNHTIVVGQPNKNDDRDDDTIPVVLSDHHRNRIDTDRNNNDHSKQPSPSSELRKTRGEEENGRNPPLSSQEEHEQPKPQCHDEQQQCEWDGGSSFVVGLQHQLQSLKDQLANAHHRLLQMEMEKTELQSHVLELLQ